MDIEYIIKPLTQPELSYACFLVIFEYISEVFLQASWRTFQSSTLASFCPVFSRGDPRLPQSCWGSCSGEANPWMTVSHSVSFYPSMLLLLWQCVWNPRHSEIWSCSQSYIFQCCRWIKIWIVFRIYISISFDKIPTPKAEIQHQSMTWPPLCFTVDTDMMIL